MQEEKKKLLGKFDIYSLGVGGTIGSGIFVMMGLGIGFTGKSISLAVLIGCIWMFFAYWFHPVMASMFTFKGGDYGMKAMIFGPTMTGISAVFTLFSGLTATMYATALVEYLAMVFPGVLAYEKLLEVLITILFFATTIKGSKFMSALNNVITVTLLASIALFIIMGIPQVQSGYFSNDFFLNGAGGFVGAISIMSLACQGSTMGPVAMMSETKNPRKTVPLIIIPIAVTVGVVYALMGIVASGVLPVEQVANQNLAVVASTIFPDWFYPIFIIGGACCAIASSLMAFLAMMKEPLYQVAVDGWLPSVFTKKTKGGYPVVTQLTLFAVTVFPLFLDLGLDGLASLCMIPMMLINAYLNFSLIKTVKKYPKQWKQSVYHMSMPIFVLLCVLATIADLIVAVTMMTTSNSKTVISLIVMLAVIVGWTLFCIKTGRVKKEDLERNKKLIVEEALKETEMAV